MVGQRRRWLGGGALAAALTLACLAPPLKAQEGRDLQISAGMGVAFSPSEQAGAGIGQAVAVEYVFAPTAWGGGRLYAGGVVTEPDAGSCSTGLDPCSVSSRIAVVGAKVRFLAPVPWVGPFFEVGGGLSLGSIETRLGPFGPFAAVDETHSGLMVHVPFSLGLAIGPRHQHEISVAYYAHPSREHVAGAIRVGIGFTVR